MKLTLRSKGIVSFVALMLYMASIAFFAAHQRESMLEIVGRIEQVHAKEQLVVRVTTFLGHSLVAIQGAMNTGQGQPTYSDVFDDIQAVIYSMNALKNLYPAMVTKDADAIETSFKSLVTKPSRSKLENIRDSEGKLLEKLNELERVLREKREELSISYRNINQNIPAIAFVMYLIGLLSYGTLVLLFFTRIAKDIKLLETRALAIANGYRGEPMAIKRRDEFGGLMEAVNQMQVVLLQTEQQQEISRQQRFHQEKMAAVGSMAAAIGHEVSNPMAAISGLAQGMIEATEPEPGLRKERRLRNSELNAEAKLVFQHTERVATIIRQMSTLTEHRSALPELLDLNGLIRSTCSFVGYDKRFNDVLFEPDLDPDLPAVTTIADHLTQILMNLLINAADAMESQAEHKPATIKISSGKVDDEIVVTLSDNGHGMSQDMLKKAFTESFTTKPVGKGRGIGLFLCRTLIMEAGGRISLESTPGVGTTVRLVLPLQDPWAQAA